MQKKNIQLKPFFSSILLFSGFALIIAIDQAVKHKIRHLGGFYVCNSGISFGLPVFPVIFWLFLSLFLLLGFIYFRHLIKNGLLTPLFMLAFILILGGALSNSIDRLFWGCIIDFISLGWTFLPVFNLADVSIFIGSCLLLFLYFRKSSPDVYK